MWERVAAVIRGALRDLVATWRVLLLTDLAYKTLAFAILVPLTALLLRWLISRTGSGAVADADIVLFFFTTRAGAVALVLGGAVVLAIAAVELGCLMAIGLAASRGVRTNARSAMSFAGRRAADILRLTGHMVLRMLLGLLPFAAAGGLVYVALLRGHDINYFLARRPPAFHVAVALAVVILATLAAVLVSTVTRWSLAIPLLLFEGASPRSALAASARRSKGHRRVIALVLAAWGAFSACLLVVTDTLVNGLGRVAAPHLAGSLVTLLLFLVALVIIWAVLGIVAAMINISMLALLVTRLWAHVGVEGEVRLPTAGALVRLSRRAQWIVAGVALLAAVGISLLVFQTTRGNQPVLVIAHRGASATAPENTLAAFRLAAEEHADFVELDVQESLDGQVLVVHDSDLMKTGGSPMRIWEHTAAELRSVDIGSHKGSEYQDERVPTLAEALAVCKGRSKVLVELKEYGHGQNLEERVAAIVEAAGMEDECAFMSLDEYQVGRMKRLRPRWRVGVLAAKGLGDLTSLGGDFLAVEARTVKVRIVRRAHRAGQEIYAWTVDDPAWMLAVMSCGADALITDTPAIAREVVARRQRMSDAQRLLAALLIRAGTRTEALEAEDALRP